MEDLEQLLVRERLKSNDRMQLVYKCYYEFAGGVVQSAWNRQWEKHMKVMALEEMDHGIGGNWLRVINMAQFAASDLMDLIYLELRTAEEYVGEFKKGYSEYLSQNEGIFHVLQNAVPADRYTHAYFSRISTLLDNFYYLVSRYFYVDVKPLVESGASIRKGIEAEVKKFNPQLGSFLKKQFGFHPVQREFNHLRNPFLHNTPMLMIQADIIRDAEPQELVSFAYNAYVLLGEEPRKEKLFDYLFNFFRHTLQHTAQAYTMLLDTPRPSPHNRQGF